MGKRSGYAQSSADVEALTLAELNAEIQRCLFRYERGGTSQGRKAFFKRLVWLEAERERLHSVTAKSRRFSDP
ncbi:hypothetical protein [Terricaulis silvestris]|uniref:Uncharacterized protein n=1 Tax=Terricaulis silvestris TaxID=2686094 RepID=A0A6I6MK85_9CAUL|nr:hypothetical protein [Terricaulis silvestris]QGZ93364.1 hypothetical protein DSM104635_00174 [Terricaulis silvestris]